MTKVGKLPASDALSIAAGDRRGRRRFEVWRSPADQPPWARPVLIGLTAVAAFVYGWHSANYLEVFYAASVRTMSANWHDFAFAAFDPRGSVTIDKLPGALWLQALSVRAFGVSGWAIVLPQIVEGTLTIPLLYRAVRRLTGAEIATIACCIVVLAPATAALNRGNISDTLMILLSILAIDATVSAIVNKRSWMLLVAGVWIGLAFQAKMIEAWLIVPVLGGTFLIAAAKPFLHRLATVAGLLVVSAAVSLSWMTFVYLTPTGQRPFVDGSSDDSIFQQVFVYNGFGRLDQGSPDQLLSQTMGLNLFVPDPPSWDRLLSGSLGLDAGWLIPVALAAIALVLVHRWRAPLDDGLRTAGLLFGGWFVVLLAAFSASSQINPYYLGALSPPTGAVLAVGCVILWRQRTAWWPRLLLAPLSLGTAVYAATLLPVRGTGLPGWLSPLLIACGVVAAGMTVASGLQRRHAEPAGDKPIQDDRPQRGIRGQDSGDKRSWLRTAAFGAAGASMLLAPAVATVSVVASRLGPFNTPFEPASLTASIRAQFGSRPTVALNDLPLLEKIRNGAPFLMATQSSAVASPFVYATGIETLPIGGFTGTGPWPTLAELKSMIAAGDFHLELQAPKTTDPRLQWIAQHCIKLPPTKGSGTRPALAAFFCLPSSVLGTAGTSPTSP